jgi:glyoxylase-like metal-dependent hydrolase (beta-lactamase superfamily II)
MTIISKLRSDTHSSLWHLSLPFQGEQDVLGPYVLAGQKEVALIDPGPGSTMPALLAGLQEIGFAPQDVTHLLLTHIHLDHAGATGELLHRMPQATAYVHSKGAPHLIDPTKFIASATRIYGDKMQELWGRIEPVPAERIHTLEGGDVLNVAGQRLEVHYTPGHAIHHVVFFDAQTRALFTGDAAGVRLQEVDYMLPTAPPPDLDLEEWSASIDQLQQLQPAVLYLTHFGATEQPIQKLEQLRENLFSWSEFVLAAMREGKTEEQIVQLLAAANEPEILRLTNDPKILKRINLASSYKMTVQGYLRYWQKRHAELLQA